MYCIEPLYLVIQPTCIVQSSPVHQCYQPHTDKLRVGDKLQLHFKVWGVGQWGFGDNAMDA